MDRVSLEQLLGQGLSLAEIGRRFDLHEATVSYWLKKHGLQAANRAKHASRGGVAREELEPLVEAGKSIAEIAEAIDRSKATVRHWLIRYGLKNAWRSRKTPIRAGKGGQAGWACHGDDALRSPRRDRLLARGDRLLPLQAMPIGRCGSETQEGKGDHRRGGRWRMLHMRI
jgi:transposase